MVAAHVKERMDCVKVARRHWLLGDNWQSTAGGLTKVIRLCPGTFVLVENINAGDSRGIDNPMFSPFLE